WKQGREPFRSLEVSHFTDPKPVRSKILLRRGIDVYCPECTPGGWGTYVLLGSQNDFDLLPGCLLGVSANPICRSFPPYACSNHEFGRCQRPSERFSGWRKVIGEGLLEYADPLVGRHAAGHG